VEVLSSNPIVRGIKIVLPLRPSGRRTRLSVRPVGPACQAVGPTCQAGRLDLAVRLSDPPVSPAASTTRLPDQIWLSGPWDQPVSQAIRQKFTYLNGHVEMTRR
jgi:hypothetical protein